MSSIPQKLDPPVPRPSPPRRPSHRLESRSERCFRGRRNGGTVTCVLKECDAAAALLGHLFERLHAQHRVGAGSRLEVTGRRGVRSEAATGAGWRRSGLLANSSVLSLYLGLYLCAQRHMELLTNGRVRELKDQPLGRVDVARRWWVQATRSDPELVSKRSTSSFVMYPVCKFDVDKVQLDLVDTWERDLRLLSSGPSR